MSYTAEPQTGHTPIFGPARTEGVHVTWDQAMDYLENLKERGRSDETIKTYHQNLMSLFQLLPSDGAMDYKAVLHWRDTLLDAGYKTSTINLRIAAVNGFLGYLGLREYQLPLWLRTVEEDDIQPELTRNEYLRLLSTARSLGKERTYLLTKVFANLGLNLHDLPQLTTEAVQDGQVILKANRTRRLVHIPACLQAELTGYIKRRRIPGGLVFITRSGRPLNRTSVTASIQSLSHDARVSSEKCNPRCLRKLYQATQESIHTNISLLVEQTYERLLEQEQITIGWEEVNDL